VPYPERHKLLTVIGTTFNGVEQFSFSLRIIPDVAHLTVDQAQVDALAAATSTMFHDANLAICPWNKMTAIKLAPIGTDGLYPPGEDAVEHNYAPAILGGAVVGTIIWPPQCAYSVGLKTAADRGPGHIGRFYLPTMAYNVNTSTGGVGDLSVSISAPLTTWIHAINATANVGTVGVIGKVGSGSSRVATGLRFGSIVDTQRRRRRQLPEVYTSTAL